LGLKIFNLEPKYYKEYTLTLNIKKIPNLNPKYDFKKLIVKQVLNFFTLGFRKVLTPS